MFGGVRLDDERRVVGFVKRGAAAVGSYHFFSTQVVRADVFRDLEPGKAAATIGGIYDRLLSSRPGAVRGYLSAARYWNMETEDEYRRTSAEIEALERGTPR
jgi:hypothetical protein